MRYEGYYTNRHNERIDLTILTEGDTDETITIGTGELFFAADPVELTSEVDDALTVVRSQRATVRLLAAEYMADFYGLTCRHARVNIRREGVLVFAGYVVPQVLTGSWDEILVEVELDCVDALGALEYERYGGVGAAGTDFDALCRSASLRTMGDILTGAIRCVASGLDLQDTTAEPVIRYDGSRLTRDWEGETPFAGLKLAERLLLSADEEDTWTLREVVEQMLRYLDLHIVQEGMVFSVYSRESLSAAASITWTALEGGSGTETATAIALHTLSAHETTDEATKLETTEAYSRLELTAQTSDTDTLIESPLKESSLTPLYGGMQKYVTEYLVDLGSTSRAKGLAALVSAALNHAPASPGDMTRTDYYVQLMSHPRWTLYFSGRPQSQLHLDGEGQQELINKVITYPGAALLLRQGKAERGGSSKDSSATSVLSTSVCMVIGVSGNGVDSEGGVVPSDEDLKRNIPSAVYEGGGEGGASLSPADSEVTNYIVLSGRVKLNPLCPVSGDWPDFEAKVKAEAEKNGGTVLVAGDVIEGIKNVTAAQGDALRMVRYWKTSDWRQDPKTDTDTRLGYVPPLSSLCPGLEFKYSGVGDKDDHVSRIAVLACMLRVGDKCVVEKPLGETLGTSTAGTGDGELADYVWQRFKTREECADDDEYYAQSFLIGFDPKIGDKLVGTDFDLRANFDVSAGLSTAGTAIPIRQTDGVSGEVHFEILGPVNVVWDEVSRRHPTFFRHTKWAQKSVALLSRVSNICLSNFEVTVVSDNGHRMGTNTDSDVVYTSREDARYSQVKDDLEMRITSALTAAEAESLGTDTHVCLSTPTTWDGTPVRTLYNTLTAETAKPELLYLDHAWREWHAPRLEVYQSVEETAQSPLSIWQRWRLPSLPGRTFRIESIDRNLTDGTARLRLSQTPS